MFVFVQVCGLLKGVIQMSLILQSKFSRYTAYTCFSTSHLMFFCFCCL